MKEIRCSRCHSPVSSPAVCLGSLSISVVCVSFQTAQEGFTMVFEAFLKRGHCSVPAGTGRGQRQRQTAERGLRVALSLLMTREHLTAIVFIVLFCGRTEALSMLVSLAARRTYPSSRAALSRRTYPHAQRGVQLTPRRQPPVAWRRGGLAWTMSTTSRASPSSLEGLQQRFVAALL